MFGRVNHTDPTVQQRVNVLVSEICAEDVPIHCSRRRGAIKRVESLKFKGPDHDNHMWEHLQEKITHTSEAN